MNTDDLTPGDIVEYLHPYTRSQKKMGVDDGKYCTGQTKKATPSLKTVYTNSTRYHQTG